MTPSSLLAQLPCRWQLRSSHLNTDYRGGNYCCWLIQGEKTSSHTCRYALGLVCMLPSQMLWLHGCESTLLLLLLQLGQVSIHTNRAALAFLINGQHNSVNASTPLQVGANNSHPPFPPLCFRHATIVTENFSNVWVNLLMPVQQGFIRPLQSQVPSVP